MFKYMHIIWVSWNEGCPDVTALVWLTGHKSQYMVLASSWPIGLWYVVRIWHLEVFAC